MEPIDIVGLFAICGREKWVEIILSEVSRADFRATRSPTTHDERTTFASREASRVAKFRDTFASVCSGLKLGHREKEEDRWWSQR